VRAAALYMQSDSYLHVIIMNEMNDSGLEPFIGLCRDAGLRATHQRGEILRELAASREHPDAETVFRLVRRRMPSISFDTVYRTLRTLEIRGLITRVSSTCERALYDANTAPHGHFVCDGCGIVRDVQAPQGTTPSLHDDLCCWGVARAVSVEVRGTCRRCMTAAAENKRSGNQNEPARDAGKTRKGQKNE